MPNTSTDIKNKVLFPKLLGNGYVWRYARTWMNTFVHFTVCNFFIHSFLPSIVSFPNHLSIHPSILPIIHQSIHTSILSGIPFFHSLIHLLGAFFWRYAGNFISTLKIRSKNNSTFNADKKCLQNAIVYGRSTQIT